MDSEKFTNRINEILKYYELNAAALAEKLGIGRSSISHIVSGRNKPSLDFILNMLENFEEVSFEWLVKGEGEFPKEKSSYSSPTLLQVESNKNDLFSQLPENREFNKPLGNSSNIEIKENVENLDVNETIKSKSFKKTERIIIFYTDGTFTEYYPSN